MSSRDEEKKAKEKWQEETLRPWLEEAGERKEKFETVSGDEVERLYIPEDIDEEYLEKLGFPGQPPFTRGVYPTLYRGRLWTMRQFSGYGTPKETNKRWRYLLKEGETGLSTAFDFPTLMGYDSDHELADGEVGKCGVAVDTLRDFEILFDGVPLDEVSTSFTINPPAPIILAMYIAIGDEQKVQREELRGTIQNDMLKEFHAQNTLVLPPEPSLKLVIDTFEYGMEKVPKFNVISISGYHIREAGSTAAQELAFTLADGMAYVEGAMRRGLDVDEFAPQLSFFFNSHLNLFEEVAKFRAARRIWSRAMEEEYGAEDPRSRMLRFHTQTAGCSLTAQQPMNNVVRTTIEALAAVLGGTQSLHTNSFDEAYALPSEDAVRVALRTQQIIAHESGAADTIDPLGGSYFIERKTDEMEAKALDYIDEIKEMGVGSVLEGVLEGIRRGWFRMHIADASHRYQRDLEKGSQILVGVNKYRADEEVSPEILKVDPELQREQIRRLEGIKNKREDSEVEEALAEVRSAAENEENTMPGIVKAVKAYASIGEIMDVFRGVYGEHKEKVVI